MVNVFDVAMLERLEEIICPRCGGSGVSTASFLLDGDDGQVVAVQTGDSCEVCNGERHVWRLREETP